MIWYTYGSTTNDDIYDVGEYITPIILKSAELKRIIFNVGNGKEQVVDHGSDILKWNEIRQTDCSSSCSRLIIYFRKEIFKKLKELIFIELEIRL